MDIRLDPYEIKTIEANTPVRITMEDGTEYIAYQFEFKDKTIYQTSEEIIHVVEVE